MLVDCLKKENAKTIQWNVPEETSLPKSIFIKKNFCFKLWHEIITNRKIN